MKRERLDQKEFYIRLSEALSESSGDIWAETVLSGSHAGEKYLVRSGTGEDSCGECAPASEDPFGEIVKDAAPAVDESSAPVSASASEGLPG